MSEGLVALCYVSTKYYHRHICHILGHAQANSRKWAEMFYPVLGQVEGIVEWMGRRGPILSNPSLGTHLQWRRREGG